MVYRSGMYRNIGYRMPGAEITNCFDISEFARSAAAKVSFFFKFAPCLLTTPRPAVPLPVAPLPFWPTLGGAIFVFLDRLVPKSFAIRFNKDVS